MIEQTEPKRPSLYVVATPMGNLADITLRALDVLRNVAVIAAEDTRVTTRLLNHYGIDVPLIALHAHNEEQAAKKLLQSLQHEREVALVSDAGTPTISDPGARAVALVRAAGYPVVPIPGPNAAICALSAAGIQTPHFLFYGFLPHQGAARRRELKGLKTCPHLLIFYEAPHRVLASVDTMAAEFGALRTITLARELTKRFETVHTCSLGEAVPWLEADSNRVKGEFVLLVEGAKAAATDEDSVQAVLAILMRELSLKQAVQMAAEITGTRKNEVYDLALRMERKT